MSEVSSGTAVIVGPGKYVSVNTARVHEIVGQSDDGTWVGIDSDGDPEGWLENGDAMQYAPNQITGPYAPTEPAKPPVTLLEASEDLASWMSAALSDDGCAEFKRSASEFLDAVAREREALVAQVNEART